jgi:hypothetical protein
MRRRVSSSWDDRLAARATAVGVAGEQVAEELRCQDHPVAPAGMRREPVAENPLRVAVAVEVRGVDEVPTEIEVRREDLLGLLDAAPGAPGVLPEGHRAQGERADPQARAAEGDVVIERHEAIEHREARRR